MKNYQATLDPRANQAGAARPGPRLVPPRGNSPVTLNLNCGAGATDPSALDSFESEADSYLGEQAKPFFLVPIWVWIGVAGLGAAWWFWGRKHFKISAI